MHLGDKAGVRQQLWSRHATLGLQVVEGIVCRREDGLLCTRVLQLIKQASRLQKASERHVSMNVPAHMLTRCLCMRQRRSRQLQCDRSKGMAGKSVMIMLGRSWHHGSADVGAQHAKLLRSLVERLAACSSLNRQISPHVERQIDVDSRQWGPAA